jgi:hypothetical protein
MQSETSRDADAEHDGRTFPRVVEHEITKKRHSPLNGRPPYTSSTGNIHSAGHGQSPVGSSARISTRPNLILALRLVFTRALMTGGKILPSVTLETPEHAAS